MNVVVGVVKILLLLRVILITASVSLVFETTVEDTLHVGLRGHRRVTPFTVLSHHHLQTLLRFTKCIVDVIDFPSVDVGSQTASL